MPFEVKIPTTPKNATPEQLRSAVEYAVREAIKEVGGIAGLRKMSMFQSSNKK